MLWWGIVIDGSSFLQVFLQSLLPLMLQFSYLFLPHFVFLFNSLVYSLFVSSTLPACMSFTCWWVSFSHLTFSSYHIFCVFGSSPNLFPYLFFPAAYLCCMSLCLKFSISESTPSFCCHSLACLILLSFVDFSFSFCLHAVHVFRSCELTGSW